MFAATRKEPEGTKVCVFDIQNVSAEWTSDHYSKGLAIPLTVFRVVNARQVTAITLQPIEDLVRAWPGLRVSADNDRVRIRDLLFANALKCGPEHDQSRNAILEARAFVGDLTITWPL